MYKITGCQLFNPTVEWTVISRIALEMVQKWNTIWDFCTFTYLQKWRYVLPTLAFAWKIRLFAIWWVVAWIHSWARPYLKSKTSKLRPSVLTYFSTTVCRKASATEISTFYILLYYFNKSNHKQSSVILRLVEKAVHISFKFLPQFLSSRLSYTRTIVRSSDVFGGIPLLDFTSLARSSMVTVGFISAKKPIQITPDRDLPWAQWTKGFIHKWCH